MNLINYTKFRNNVAIRTEEGNCFRYKDLEELQKKFESNIVGRPLICILAENNLESIIGYLTCIKDDYVARGSCLCWKAGKFRICQKYK